MWSIGLLPYSWLFLQTIGSAHFSRGMSSDRPVEHTSAPLYHSTNEIRIIVNYSETETGRRGYSRGVDPKIWQIRNLEQNHLLHPHPSQLRSYDTNLVSGQLVIVRSASPNAGKSVSRSSLENAGDACGSILNPGRRPWIAVVKASNRCDTKKKIRNLFQNSNASGAIIYGNEGVSAPKNSLHSRNTLATATGAGFGGAGVKSSKRGASRSRRLAVWVKYSVLADVLARCNATTECNATLIVTVHPTDGLINRTSVLFVSISFILLMIISLAWLVFYYVQRFRYIHAKERLSRRLANAAKKALTKIPVKTLLRGDTETENEYDQCAVCIEQYKPSDTIRILPCRHYFHKSCIDPWLLEQRSCPMCKLDILKAYGLQVRGFSEGPSDTLVEHSDMNALGRATSVSLEVTVRETTTAGGEESTTGGGDEDAGGVTTRLVSDEGQSDSSSPGCSTSGARVTIEPPEVQYHHPGANVKVVVEQHAPVEDEEEDEEEAVSRPLFSGGAETKEVVVTECI